MSRYETEEEQIEAFKKWWNQNGTQLLSAVLVVVIAFGGWRWWQNNQYVTAANASMSFDLLQKAANEGEFAEVSREALTLMQEQPDSPYAWAAALLHATYKYRSGDVDEAINNLNWVTEKSTDKAIQVTAHLRLARVYLEQEKYTDADAQLKTINSKNLNPSEQGNADYVAAMLALVQEDKVQAHKLFTKVVDNPQTEKNLSSLAQMQLNDLADVEVKQ
jgi:predicted negative regulator of RcsB-dependent stress response